MNTKEKVIRDYIDAYNDKDVEKMIENLSDDVVFENVSNDEITLRLQGKDAFKKQAITALSYFSTRKQTILDLKQNENTVEIDIDYEAIAAMDFPNGIKKGDEIKLKGKSIFEFAQEGQVTKLTDIS